MKKNFLMVAALLIAAMLMVVSCTQEVAPKNDGLVEASFSVGFGKDISIDSDYDETVITYVYSLDAKWNPLENGADIYGEVTDEVLVTGKGIADRVPNHAIGFITPGLWEVSVKGYTDYNEESKSGTLILSGSTKTYFTQDNKTATVLVSPVESGSASVSVDLAMQDIDGVDSINVKFTHIHSNKVVADETINKGTAVPGKGEAYQYKKENIALNKVGYYKVEVTVPNYKGGYVRTFLATNDDTINITGSVYPSEFIESKLSIVTVSMNSANLTIDTTKNSSNKYYNKGEIVLSLNDSNTYLSDTDIENLEKNAKVSSVTTSTNYEWFLNGEAAEGTFDETSKKYTLSINNPGVYSVSCKITYQVTVVYNDGSNNETKSFYGNANSPEFIIENKQNTNI